MSTCASKPLPDISACLSDRVVATYQVTKDLPPLLAGVVALNNAPGFRGVSCHGVLHLIGVRVFALVGDEAISFGIGGCSGGYYHGVLQAGGDAEKSKELCGVLITLDAIDCMHGDGHAAWLLYHEVPAALDFCAGAYVAVCGSGVFMEMSIEGDRAASLLDYCADVSLTDSTRRLCYDGLVSNIAIVHPAEAAQWCVLNEPDSLTPNFDACWLNIGKGVATGANEMFPTDDLSAFRDITKFCDGQVHCLVSASTSLRKHSARPSLASDLCTAAYSSKDASQGALSCQI